MSKCPCKGDFLDKLLQPSILALLLKKEMHGFSILKSLNEKEWLKSGNNIDPTGLYRTLKKMEEMGVLHSYFDVKDKVKRKRIYEITDEGRVCLKAWRKTLINYKKNLETLIKDIVTE